MTPLYWLTHITLSSSATTILSHITLSSSATTILSHITLSSSATTILSHYYFVVISYHHIVSLLLCRHQLPPYCLIISVWLFGPLFFCLLFVCLLISVLFVCVFCCLYVLFVCLCAEFSFVYCGLYLGLWPKYNKPSEV